MISISFSLVSPAPYADPQKLNLSDLFRHFQALSTYEKPRTMAGLYFQIFLISQVTFLRLANPAKPNRAVPNSQAAAGTGTAETDSWTLSNSTADAQGMFI